MDMLIAPNSAAMGSKAVEPDRLLIPTTLCGAAKPIYDRTPDWSSKICALHKNVL
jgi:hypothetical protein